MNIPFQTDASYINDTWALQEQHRPTLPCGNFTTRKTYTRSGITPAIGQVTETQVVDPKGITLRFVGMVLEVHNNEFIKSSIAGGNRALREIAQALIGKQTEPSLVSYSILILTQEQVSGSLFAKCHVYRIEYKANESLPNAYCVARIQMIPNYMVALLPQFILEFLLEQASNKPSLV